MAQSPLPAPVQGDPEPPPEEISRRRWRLLGDLIVFEAKMLLEGVRDVVVVPLAFLAAVADLLLGGRQLGRFFYEVMEQGHRFDRWLNLFGSRKQAEADADKRGTLDEHVDRLGARLIEESERSRTLRSARKRIDSVLDAISERRDQR